MYTQQPKKLLIINILDILRKYTDENHRLSLKEIVDTLEREYDMKAGRRAVRRNILDLETLGYNIEYTETKRMTPDPKTGELEETYILSDFYLVRDFTDGELRLLIDSLLFSKHIPYSQCKELVGKLEGLSSKYFLPRVRHIRTMPDNSPANKQLFYTIEIIDEAIERERQISFTYNEYGTDKKLHPRKNSDGAVRTYIVNPYQMAATNGRYYLIGNYDKYDDVANYRLDRITNIKLLGTPSKPKRDIHGLEHGFDLPRHMMEHIYMFSGESASVTFRMKKYIINDAIDWFGRDIVFFDETDDEVSAKVTVNQNAMRRWAMQYALHMKVLSPQSLADDVKGDLKAATNGYQDITI